jgi:hypothetical protein
MWRPRAVGLASWVVALAACVGAVRTPVRTPGPTAGAGPAAGASPAAPPAPACGDVAGLVADLPIADAAAELGGRLGPCPGDADAAARWLAARAAAPPSEAAALGALGDLAFTLAGLTPARADRAQLQLARARLLDLRARSIRDPEQGAAAWDVAAHAWDLVVTEGALPRPVLRDAAWNAVAAIRLARSPDEPPPDRDVQRAPPDRVTREAAAVDRHVALLDAPDGPDGLDEQFQVARLLWSWGRFDDVVPRLSHILNVRRDLELSPFAADLLLDTLNKIRDDKTMAFWVGTLRADADFIRRNPDSGRRFDRLARQIARHDADHLAERHDYVGCAAAFRLLANEPGAEQVDQLLFNQAICQEKAGDVSHAAATYRRIAHRFPKSPVAAAARTRYVQLIGRRP